MTKLYPPHLHKKKKKTTSPISPTVLVRPDGKGCPCPCPISRALTDLTACVEREAEACALLCCKGRVASSC